MPVITTLFCPLSVISYGLRFDYLLYAPQGLPGDVMDEETGGRTHIKKIIAQRAFGAIATHDIEVCLTTADFPQVLANNCFEVQIVNDELVFDYKLRTGVCKNKSATFLMEKMGIIPPVLP